jgi:lipopolysaccharide biosynthesis protein
MRSIAFYLPQFHPIPENNSWWGAGFTEWTKVVVARPRFRGHYQPRLPADLGFYDLRVPETRAAQATLARDFGVDGFCYYHYWFGGKRLLERPFEEVLGSKEPDFPFMLCWANENWTRRWDGGEDQLLITQRHSREDDRLHVRSLFSAFDDPRYIRVEGRPVFLVYAADALPDPVSTTATWRAEVRSAGLPDLYLCRVESMRTQPQDPRPLGFDAAVEFMPDLRALGSRLQPNRVGRMLRRTVRPGSGYRWNHVYAYDAIVARALSRSRPPYPRFPCVMPSWDNSPRVRRHAFIVQGSTPEKYERWLARTVANYEPPSPEEDFIFTNAWNEWAEGNYLEPDRRWGHAYLEAHKRGAR